MLPIMSTPRAPPPQCLGPWLRRERLRTRFTSVAVWTSLSVRPARITPDTSPLTAASLPLCQAKKRSMNLFSTPCSANYYAPAGCSESDSTALHVGGSPNPLTSRVGRTTLDALSPAGVSSLSAFTARYKLSIRSPPCPLQPRRPGRSWRERQQRASRRRRS